MKKILHNGINPAAGSWQWGARISGVFLVLGVIAAMILGLAACGSPVGDALVIPGEAALYADPYELPDTPDPRLPESPTRAVDWQDDGTLRLSMRPPQTLNPLLNRDPSVAQILQLLFEPLAVLDENLRPVGHLASLEFSLDYTVVIVTIRNDTIWSDGLPVTADDLIFSVETLRNAPHDAIYRRFVENIEDVARLNDRTARISFVDAHPAVGYALLFPLIPRHYYLLETDPASLRNMMPVGNGPFLFEGMGQAVQLVRNAHTFRALPAFERVEVLLLPDAQIDLYAFDRGLIDALRLPMPEWTRNPGATPVHGDDFPAMYFEHIGFNLEREIFHDIYVRQGIAQLINASEIIETLYLHHAVRAATPIHPLSWKYDPAVQPLPYDPQRANMLLRDVPRDAYNPWQIIVGADSPERVTIARRLADALNGFGIYVETHELPHDEFVTRLMGNDFDLYVGWMELCFAPDFAFLFPHDPVLEGLFAVTRFAATETAFLAAMGQLQQAFIDQVPVVGLAFRHSSVLMHPRIIAGEAPAAGRPFLYVNRWR
ncbi:MAG: ABC transporter substrate-binding protein [Defluviitaleaceae bacterium]|nr:ABC transporter substrate-binding protein [Defluviitaleaceae bacterium]